MQSLEKKVNTLNQELSNYNLAIRNIIKYWRKRMRLKNTHAVITKKIVSWEIVKYSIMDADAAIGQSMEIFDEIQHKNRLITSPPIFAWPRKTRKKKRDSHIYPFDYLSNGSYWWTNCESIKNQSEVMKEINHVRKINLMKQRVNILPRLKF